MSEETEDSLATRPSLLAALKDWSQQTAWRDFDHDYAPLIRNVARKAGLAEDEADEAAQETLIAVAKKIGEFKHAGNRGSFRAWLYQQARWRIADQFRARTHRGAHPGICNPHPPHGKRTIDDGRSDAASTAESVPDETDPAAAPEVDPAFQQLWDAEWDEHLRQTALACVKRQVSARQFQLFDLHALQGLSVREAAAAAGSTKAAVYMAKSRVGRLIKRAIKKLSK